MPKRMFRRTQRTAKWNAQPRMRRGVPQRAPRLESLASSQNTQNAPIVKPNDQRSVTEGTPNGVQPQMEIITANAPWRTNSPGSKNRERPMTYKLKGTQESRTPNGVQAQRETKSRTPNGVQISREINANAQWLTDPKGHIYRESPMVYKLNGKQESQTPNGVQIQRGTEIANAQYRTNSTENRKSERPMAYKLKGKQQSRTPKSRPKPTPDTRIMIRVP